MSDPEPMRPRATLAMVALAAGVSTPTVSKVLNGRPDVSAATRSRVERALQDSRYQVAARRTPRATRSIELVFGDFRNPYFGELLHGVTGAAAEAGVDVVVGRFVGGDGRAWARQLSAAGREGVVILTSELTAAQIDAFEAAGLSLVVIDPVNLPKVTVCSIGATNWTGGLTATEHLIRLGHERIAFLGGPLETACSRARLHGYRAALENAGLPLDAELICHDQFTFDTGYHRGAELLSLPDPPTAVFAGCDPIAFGLLAVAHEKNVRVPDDLSVVGFDDTYAASWSTPALTTVHQPLQEMGRAALRTLLNMAGGRPPDSYHIELATHLEIRGTCGPRRSASPPIQERP